MPSASLSTGGRIPRAPWVASLRRSFEISILASLPQAVVFQIFNTNLSSHISSVHRKRFIMDKVTNFRHSSIENVLKWTGSHIHCSPSASFIHWGAYSPSPLGRSLRSLRKSSDTTASVRSHAIRQPLRWLSLSKPPFFRAQSFRQAQ